MMIQRRRQRRKGDSSGTPIRPAFTLLEILIVLSIIIVILSLGVPSVVRVLDKAKFRSAVFEFQAELGRTRLLAMKSGTPMVFRYRTGTSFYQTIPKSLWEQEKSFRSVPSSDIQTLGETALFLGGMTVEADADSRSPRGISATGSEPFSTESGSEAIGSLTSPPSSSSTLSSSPFSAETSPALSPSESSPFSGAAEPFSAVHSFSAADPFSGAVSSEETGWSEPILFFPNGRTSTAVVFLQSRPVKGKAIYYSEISLRGITGTGRVSSISTAPPDSPDFPSVLSDEAFARLRHPAGKNFAAGKGGRTP